MNFLEYILENNSKKYTTDAEINNLYNYLEFFYNEFLVIFSERKLRLDFKYSLERDNFHHRYQELKRKLDDYIDEAERSKERNFLKDSQLEWKRRAILLKRNLLIESNRFFKRLSLFAVEINNDLNGAQTTCMNGNEIIRFELTSEKHFLSGKTIKVAFEKLAAYCDEIIKFLNIPDVETK